MLSCVWRGVLSVCDGSAREGVVCGDGRRALFWRGFWVPARRSGLGVRRSACHTPPVRVAMSPYDMQLASSAPAWSEPS